MRRIISYLVVALLAFGGIAAGNLFIDEPLTEAESRHQRIHEHKKNRPAVAAPGIPAERVSNQPCVDGKSGTFPCSGIDLLSFVPLDEFRGSEAQAARGGGTSDVWGWTDPETGDEYAILGKTNGTAFFRVTDPANPVYLGDVPNRAAAHLVWHDIKVYEDHAFIVSESAPHGMQVFDLTRLRDATEPQTWTEDAFYPLNFSAHNVAINEETGYAYIVGGNAGLVVPDQCASGLHIVDIADPTQPTFAGCYIGDEGPGTGPGIVGAVAENSPLGYIHDTQCVVYHGPDTEHDGKEICLNSSEDKFSIVDVTDKSNPVRLGFVEYEETGYTHQGWLTEDQSTFLLGDELDEQDFEIPTTTLIFDVSDLDAPELTNKFQHGTRSIDHNMYTKDGILYQSNYTAGLRVFDLDNVATGQLDEIAYFDTFPLHDNPEFFGTWSNYVYFDSGTIAVSGMDEGLFLLKVHDDVLAENAETIAASAADAALELAAERSEGRSKRGSD